MGYRTRRPVPASHLILSFSRTAFFALTLLLSSLAQGYTGSQACAQCHQQEYEDWRGSHHDLAMQEATPDTVLGDFKDATFTYGGVTTRFYRDGETFMVRTDGEDGELTDFPVRYVFGVYPLQQYLVRFPRGRYQVLSLCWDSRPEDEGGQRWFHLYQDERIAHDDELHWTGLNQNWNFMCAQCHSTNLLKNYDVATDSYKTTWSEIDVSCESCHGPASNHLAWAKDQGLGYANKGFAGPIKNDAVWTFEVGKPTATRQPNGTASVTRNTGANAQPRLPVRPCTE